MMDNTILLCAMVGCNYHVKWNTKRKQKEVLTSALIDCVKMCTLNLLLDVNRSYIALSSKEDLDYFLLYKVKCIFSF